MKLIRRVLRDFPGLLLMAVLFLLPVLVLVAQSLAAQWEIGQVAPAQWSFQWWVEVQAQPSLAPALVSSALYSFGAFALSLVLTLPAARVLAFANFRGQLVVEALLLAPAVIPVVTTAMGNHRWMTALGWTDNALVLIPVLSFYSYPYLLRSLSWGYRLMGSDLRSAARNLGASSARIFWTVELPLLAPAIFSGGTIVFLAAYSDFFIVSLFGGGVVRSIATTIMPILTGSQRQLSAVLSLVFVAMPLLAFAFIDFFMVRWQRRRSMAVVAPSGAS